MKNTEETSLLHLENVSKRYLITFYSSSKAIGFEIRINTESKEDAENKAKDMNSTAYFTIDEIV